MRKFDVLVVGGGPGGFVSALLTKRLSPDKSVALVRRDEKAIIPCGVPYVFGTLKDADKNILPDAPLKNAGVEVVVGEVSSIDLKEKKVVLSSGEELGYEKLVLATGSFPVRIPVKGTDLGNVFYVVKSYDAMAQLKDAIEKAKNIVIVGGGFIGVEIAEDVARNYGDKKVVIVEMLPHCLQRNFDPEFCELAEEKLKSLGIEIKTNTLVQELVGEGGVVKSAKLSTGEEIPADLVIIAGGTRANAELAEKAGLKMGVFRAIVVDDFCRTSDANVWAVGDCAEKRDPFTGKPTPVMLASIAAREGRVAALNILGIGSKGLRGGTVPVFSTIIDDLAMGAVGMTESAAKAEGFDIVVGNATAPDKHPGALPGMKELRVKLIFSKVDGRLLGAEAAGGASVGELVNVLGVAAQLGATVYDLVTMEFGTHPRLTASPIAYPILAAAQDALAKLLK